jgi:heme/copper-type cytochrome/quinol oxidase subunit 2
MKQTSWIILTWLSLLVSNAEAVMSMQEKEGVQTFVWILEAVTFVTIVAIFWFVWQLSKRERKNRRSKVENLVD